MDAQNNIIGMFDRNGNVVVQYAYDAWGNILSTTGSLASTVGVKNPYRYRGYRYDNETGWYYLQSRYYNPIWERFINADTVDYAGENMFSYCYNNPISNTDYSGSQTVSLKQDLFWIHDTNEQSSTYKKLFYGGDQSWFINSYRVNRGCGPVAGANITCYLALRFKSLKNLYNYPAGFVRKDDFTKHMNNVYQYITSSFFGCVDPGNWADALCVFASSKGVTLGYSDTGMQRSISLGSAIAYIKKGLKYDCPVALGTWFINNASSLGLSNFQKHWMTITKITDDESTSNRHVTIKISSWGQQYYLNYVDIYKGTHNAIPTFYSSLVYFTH